ncbi:MAG: glycosyltransferase family 39 protein [Ignavibacteriales bacterium]|nr:glycosyltransferase family 39 protein [Ignavibacteriales bacterium]
MTARTLRSALIIGMAFFLAGLFRLSDLSLYTDSTRYLIWGNSLAHFQGFTDATQPVANRFVMNAPLYPLILAPVLLAAPLSLTAAKVWTLLWGTAALILFFVWLRRSHDGTISLVGTLILGMNALFFVTSTEVLSEAPFIAFSMILLLSFDSYEKDRGNARARWLLLITLALLSLLREVGAAFVIAALVVFFQRKEGKNLVITAASAGALFLIWTIRNNVMIESNVGGQTANLQYIMQHFVTGPDDSLIAEFLIRAWLNLKGYVINVGAMVFFPFPDNLVASPSALADALHSAIHSGRTAILVGVVAAAAYGIRLDMRASPAGKFRALTMVLFLVIVLLYPVHDIRFLLPLVPLILFSMILAFSHVRERVRPRTAVNAAGAVIALGFLVPNAVALAGILKTNLGYQTAPAEFYRPVGNSAAGRYFGQPWGILGEWIRENTAEDAVIASPAKELALFIGSRKLMETSRVLPATIFERALRDHNVQYLVTTKIWNDFETYEIVMQESRRLWYFPVASFANLTIYEVRSKILEPPPARIDIEFDTTTAGGLLLAGRRDLQNLRYEAALYRFARAFGMLPGQPELHFQLLTALSMVGDSSATMRVYEKLFTVPQSTAYTQVAQSLLGTMNQMLAASRQTNASQYAFMAFEGGLSYWSLGFPRMAFSVMQNVVRTDSTNFVGALWATHIARQIGDTVASNQFLQRLKTIDITAQIVGDWDAIKTMEESLRLARSAKERTRLHTGIAKIYTRIELFDEATDALERALATDPANVDVLLSLADVLEKKRALWGAYRMYSEILKREPHNSFAQERLDSLAIDL